MNGLFCVWNTGIEETQKTPGMLATWNTGVEVVPGVPGILVLWNLGVETVPKVPGQYSLWNIVYMGSDLDPVEVRYRRKTDFLLDRILAAEEG